MAATDTRRRILDAALACFLDIRGREIVQIARDRLENKFEAQGILKQLEIPKADWPEKCK
jgi:hypothetical protein